MCRKLRWFLLLSFMMLPALNVQGQTSLMRYIFDAFNNGQFGEALREFSEDAEIRVTGHEGLDPASREELISFWGDQVADASEYRFYVKSMTEFDSIVIVQYIFAKQIAEEGLARFSEGAIFAKMDKLKINQWLDLRNTHGWDNQPQSGLKAIERALNSEPDDSHIKLNASEESAYSFYDALQSQNYDLLNILLSEDLLIKRHTIFEEASGRDEFIKSVQELSKRRPNFKLTLDKVLTHGNKAFVLGRAYYTKGVRFLDILSFRDGAIYQIERYFNSE